jgi:hypothetical protein
VDAAHDAARDEVRHARACFSLASAYAGADVGPGAFKLEGALEIRTELEQVAVSAVLEGCIGETLAAVQAAEQLARATDPAVRGALATIAEDEARHAELAWRFVAWAIGAGGEPVRRAVLAAFDSALASAPEVADHPGVDATALAEHGRATPEALRAAFRETIADTIRPAVRLLVAQARAGTAPARV